MLLKKGILNGDLGPLLCVVAVDAVPGVPPNVDFGEWWSECRKESTMHDTVSLGIQRVEFRRSGHIHVEVALSR